MLNASEPNVSDIDKPGGWAIQVKTPPSLLRTFYVYELDKAKALSKIPISAGETLEASVQVNIHALTGLGMKPGDVIQHG